MGVMRLDCVSVLDLRGKCWEFICRVGGELLFLLKWFWVLVIPLYAGLVCMQLIGYWVWCDWYLFWRVLFKCFGFAFCFDSMGFVTLQILILVVGFVGDCVDC